MGVMVTGASGLLGRAVVRALATTAPQVRCAVRDAERAEGLRAMGAKVTVGRLDEVDALAEVLPGIDTLVHLVGGPNQPDDVAMLDTNLRSTVTALDAALAAGVRRFQFVSVPGADPAASHPYLRSKGLAEEAVAAAGLDHLIVRSAHAYGVGGFWFTAVVQGAADDPPFVIGGSQPLAPVLADDVAAVLAAADARPEPLVGTFGLEGPDVVTAAQLVDVLTGASTQPQRVEGEAAVARLTGSLGIPVTRATAEWLALPSRAADLPGAAAALGVRTTPLAEGLRRTLERAGDG